MIRTRVGYTGGTTPAPTYRAMGDHTEALQVDFDPRVLSYEALLDRLWRSHDPTRSRGSVQYRAAIWVHDETQRAIATATGEAAARARSGSLMTAIEPLGVFTRAEDYHQKWSLRKAKTVTLELVERFGSDRAMVDSTEAARANGLLRGYGELERLVRTLGLSERAEKALRSRV